MSPCKRRINIGQFDLSDIEIAHFYSRRSPEGTRLKPEVAPWAPSHILPPGGQELQGWVTFHCCDCSCHRGLTLPSAVRTAPPLDGVETSASVLFAQALPFLYLFNFTWLLSLLVLLLCQSTTSDTIDISEEKITEEALLRRCRGETPGIKGSSRAGGGDKCQHWDSAEVSWRDYSSTRYDLEAPGCLPSLLLRLAIIYPKLLP